MYSLQNITSSKLSNFRSAKAAETLPSTTNPRSIQSPSPSPESSSPHPAPSSESSSPQPASELKQTKNPRYNPPDPNPAPSSADAIERVTSSINDEAYTPKGHVDKFQERQFRGEIPRQTSSQRARLLNSMYADLLNESVKKDPYLRHSGSTGCDYTKGTRNFEWNNDC